MGTGDICGHDVFPPGSVCSHVLPVKFVLCSCEQFLVRMEAWILQRSSKGLDLKCSLSSWGGISVHEGCACFTSMRRTQI